MRIATAGYVVHSGGKYGQVNKNNPVRLGLEAGLSTEKTNERSLSIKTDLGGGLGQTKGSKSSQSNNFSASFNHQYVTAIANNCWTIRSPDRVNTFLQGALILSEVLCSISSSGVSNQKRLGGRIEVPPGELKIRPVGGQPSKLKHHKLVQALIYKRMKESGSKYILVDEYTAEIVVSAITIEDGDI